MKKGLKKIFNGLWKFSKFCIKWVVIVAVIGTIINSVGGLLSKRAEKKQEAAKNNTTVTSVDNTNDEKLKNNTIIEDKTNETKVVITENQNNFTSTREEELAKKQELEKSYSYVSGPIVRNGKKYWKVRIQGVPSAGWVDYETNIEVIKPGTYDYIGNEIKIAGIPYVQISVPYDDGYAYGLLNLNDFTEVIPCSFYKDVDIFTSEEKVECLQKDRETLDVYQPDENTKVLTKK